MTPEELKYKWEAFKYSSYNKLSQDPPFTMDSIATLKDILQRDLQKQSTVKKGPRKMLVGFTANVNRAKIPAAFARSVPGGGGVQVKIEGGHDILAGPSKVAFRGPKNDPESRKKRACECLLYFILINTPETRLDHYMYEKVTTRSLGMNSTLSPILELNSTLKPSMIE